MFGKKGSVKTIDATILSPQQGGLKLILSVARLDGALDNPMMELFSKRWANFRKELASLYATRTGAYKLGFVGEPYCVQSDVWVMHCVCLNAKGKFDLDGFRECLKALCKKAEVERAGVHISNILVNKFPKMTKLVEEELTNNGVNVLYYNEPN